MITGRLVNIYLYQSPNLNFFSPIFDGEDSSSSSSSSSKIYYSRPYIKRWKQFLKQLIPIKKMVQQITFISSSSSETPAYQLMRKALHFLQQDKILRRHLIFSSDCYFVKDITDLPRIFTSLQKEPSEADPFNFFFCIDRLFDFDLIQLMQKKFEQNTLFVTYHNHRLPFDFHQVKPEAVEQKTNQPIAQHNKLYYKRYRSMCEIDVESYTSTEIFVLTNFSFVSKLEADIKKRQLILQLIGGQFLTPAQASLLRNSSSPIRSYRQKQRPALFLDRDGVIIEDVPYLNDSNQIHWIPEILKVLQWAKQKKMKIFIISNQSGIGRGKITEENHRKITEKIKNYLKQHDIFIDGFFHSPYHPQAMIEKYQKNSLCRKPFPGMMIMAANQSPVDLSRSIMIGDKDTDILELKGPKYYVIQRQYPLKADVKESADQVFETHQDLVNFIMNKTQYSYPKEI